MLSEYSLTPFDAALLLATEEDWSEQHSNLSDETPWENYERTFALIEDSIAENDHAKIYGLFNKNFPGACAAVSISHLKSAASRMKVLNIYPSPRIDYTSDPDRLDDAIEYTELFAAIISKALELGAVENAHQLKLYGRDESLRVFFKMIVHKINSSKTLAEKISVSMEGRWLVFKPA